MANILFVDSSGPYSAITRIGLTTIGGHKVTTASTLQKAVDILKNESFDLLVTGWLFPGESAAGLAEQFLDTEKPVIINSSFGQGEETQLDGFVASHNNTFRIKSKGDINELLEMVEASLDPACSVERSCDRSRVEG